MIPYVPSAIVAVAAPAPPACTVEVQSPNGSPSTLQSLQSNSLNETAAMPGGGVTSARNSISSSVTASVGTETPTVNVIVNPA